MVNTKPTAFVFTLLMLWLGLGRSSAQVPLNLQQFRQCVSSSGTEPTCMLAWSASPYLVGTTIQVSRSSIVIKGQFQYGSYPVLKRDRSVNGGNGPENIMRVNVGLSNVTIENLEFNGSYGSSSGPPTTCDWSQQINTCGEWSDLDVFLGTAFVTIQHSNFRDAAERAIRLRGNLHTVQHVSIGDGRNCGVSIGAAYSVNVLSSTLYNNLGAGVCANGAPLWNINIGGPSQAQGNYFYHNHFGKPDGSDGGQIYVGEGNSVIRVQNNIIQGAYSASDPGINAGIEVDPSAFGVTITGNTIYSHGLEGINIKCKTTVLVDGHSIHSNKEGVRVLGRYGLHEHCPTEHDEPKVAIRDPLANNSQWDLRLYGIKQSERVCTTTHPAQILIEESGGFAPHYISATCPSPF